LKDEPESAPRRRLTSKTSDPDSDVVVMMMQFNCSGKDVLAVLPGVKRYVCQGATLCHDNVVVPGDNAVKHANCLESQAALATAVAVGPVAPTAGTSLRAKKKRRRQQRKTKRDNIRTVGRQTMPRNGTIS